MGRRKLTAQQKMVVPLLGAVSLIVYIFIVLIPTVAYRSGEEKDAFITDYKIVSAGERTRDRMWYELRIDGKKYEAEAPDRFAYQGDTISVVKIADQISLYTKKDMLTLAFVVVVLSATVIGASAQTLYLRKTFLRRVLPLVVGICLAAFAVVATLLYM